MKNKKCVACELFGVDFKSGRSKRCITCETNGIKRKCSKCNINQVYREYKHCRPCLNLIDRKKRAEDPEYRAYLHKKDNKYFILNRDKMLAAATNYSRTPKGKFKLAQRIAKRRNLDWQLSADEYLIITNNVCYYCEYNLGSPTKAGLGLDRINNNKGYEKDNVLSCCGTCNKLRGNWLSVEETKVAVNAVLLLRELGNIKK